MMVASDSLIWQPWRVTITSTATRRNKPGKLPAAQLPGGPRDRLAARFRALVEAGILERRQYQASPARWDYHLTAAGRDLAPVLRALLAWGDRWVSAEPPATLRHGDHDLDPDWV